jgi:DNA uptake protein ComE-like DNA-binding protein
MSDERAPSTQESTAQMMQSLTQYLPAFMQAQNAQVLPQAQAELNTAQQISPAYQRLTADLYKQFAPELAGVGRDIDSANRLKTAETDAAILAGSGRDLARTYSSIDKELNPEYYSAREAAGGGLQQLLGSINLNDANPEAERLINQENARTGNLGNNSATNTVANALSFGTAMNERRNTLANAINTASGFLQPASNAQFNPATAALNRPTSNTGLSQFGGVTQPGQQAYQSGNNMLNNISQIRQAEMGINANRRDVLDRMNEVGHAVGSIS